ncbi:hypothetical protein C8R42DRAFT_729266 [Lentinula raphanica]|nr:hypothetical protein C8R42DRAFT_729266 [Lentinula raphanica]
MGSGTKGSKDVVIENPSSQARTHDHRWYHPPSHSHHHSCKRDRTGFHALLLSVQHFNQALVAVEITQVALLLVRLPISDLSSRVPGAPVRLHVGCFDGCYHFGSEKAHWQTCLLEWNRWNRTEHEAYTTGALFSLDQISETHLTFPQFHARPRVEAQSSNPSTSLVHHASTTAFWSGA